MPKMKIEKLGVPLPAGSHYNAMAECPYHTSGCGISGCGTSCTIDSARSTYCPKNDQQPEPAEFESELAQKL